MSVLPVVSVIIPTFNSANFIIEAVESALDQVGCLLDIVVVDDGSTDNTEVILNNYIINGLISYYKQENKGPAAARNLGIEKSKGDYVCFLDADDTLKEKSIEKRLRVFSDFNDIGLVCTNFEQIVVSDEKHSVHIDNPSRNEFLLDAMKYLKIRIESTYIFNKEIYYDPIVLMRLIWTGTVMIQKKVINEIGFFDEKLKASEDIDLWFRIAQNFNIAFLDEFTANYYVNNTGITSNRELYYTSAIKVLQNHLNKLLHVPKMYKLKIKKKLSSYNYILGYDNYLNRNYKISNTYFKRSISYNKNRFDNYKFYVITSLPPLLIDYLRILYKKKFIK